MNSDSKLIRVVHHTKGNKLIAHNSDYPAFVEKVRSKYEIKPSSKLQFQDSLEAEIDEDVFDEFIDQSGSSDEKKPILYLVIDGEKQQANTASTSTTNSCSNATSDVQWHMPNEFRYATAPVYSSITPDSNQPTEPPPPYTPAPGHGPTLTSTLPPYQERPCNQAQYNYTVFTAQPRSEQAARGVVVSRPKRGQPVRMQCPYCRTDITTNATYIENWTTCFCAAVLCAVGLWPCFFIPFVVDDCKSLRYVCPECGEQIDPLHNS